MKKEKIIRKHTLIPLFIALGFIIILAAGALITRFRPEIFDLFIKNSNSAVPAAAKPLSDSETEPEPAPVTETKRITVASTGDILIHQPIFTAAYNSASKSYNFDNIFTHLGKYMSKYDYKVANLEVTLGGNSKKYSGYPLFNCPDSIADAAKAAGFNMLLTSNNHTYDTGTNGLLRTLDVLREKNIDHTGTRKSDEEKKYTVKDIGGAKLGISCYTYETATDAGRKALNGLRMSVEAAPLVNSFNYANLEEFYTEITENLTNMKAEGAAASMIYVHWGDEYNLTPNKWQTAMAQRICDIGYDVIIGGHPHVVQPVDVLTSADKTRRTACLYSMGNAVSNQRRDRMNLKSGHTEDGVLFETEFALFSDGTVRLTNINVIPTWVNLHSSGGKNVYQILPLDDSEDWKSKFGLSDATNTKARQSFERTMKLVSAGISKFRGEAS